MQATLYLAAASFATALFTAAVGIGGGLGLLSVMPSFMPVSAVVPVHGLTQFFSNASRFLFDYRQAEIRLLPCLFRRRLPRRCGRLSLHRPHSGPLPVGGARRLHSALHVD